MEYWIDKNYINIKIDKYFDKKTVNDFLDYFKHSRKNKYILIRDEKIKINGLNCLLESVLCIDDIVQILIDEEDIDYVSDNILPDIVYEDELVLIVNKPEGMIVHGDKNKKGSLSNLVARYYEEKEYKFKVRYIHRLDEDTKGLVLFCKLSFFQPYFDFELSNKNIKRFYKAIVYGNLNETITINKPIGRDRHNSKKFRISNTGKEAKTKVSLLKRRNKYSLVECELFTGRTHQIRVHLNSIGLYIVNDNLYGKASKEFNTMGLFAYRLEFNNPINNKKMVVICPPDKNLDYFKML